MNRLLYFLFYLPFATVAQAEISGVEFTKGLSWEQVKVKSMLINKYIFVDVYTTWCIPCRKMSLEVFNNDSIGKLVNDHFVSIKMQVDVSKNDNEETKKWYADAKRITAEYKISEIPCYLFFAPGGNIVYKSSGYKNVQDFLVLIDNVLSKENLSNYNKLEEFKRGKLDTAKIYNLACYANLLGKEDVAKQMGDIYIENSDISDLVNPEKIQFVNDVVKDKKLADSLARIYKRIHLDNLSNYELCNYDNLLFINKFRKLFDSKSNLFQLCYSSPNKVDLTIKRKGWAHNVVKDVITMEEIDSKLNKNGAIEVNSLAWQSIKDVIGRTYPAVDAELIILDYQLNYYKALQKWPLYTKTLITRVAKYGAFGPIDVIDFNLNNLAWELFEYSNNKRELKVALKWSDSAINLCKDSNKPNWMDTKANILYKLGRVKDAIRLQKQALALKPESQAFKTNLANMINDKPTWTKRKL